MKILLGILACDVEGYDKMVQACRETCYANLPSNVEVFYLYGHREGKEVRFPYYIEDDCLYADSRESRRTAIDKTLMFYDYCGTRDDYDYVIRANCGSYIDIPKLIQHIQTLPTSGVYQGIVGNVAGVRYCSGSAYIMSKDVVKLIATNTQNVRPWVDPQFIMDDVAIGEFLATQKILPLEGARRADVFYNDIDDVDLSNYHYYFRHSIDPRCFYKVHQKLT